MDLNAFFRAREGAELEQFREWLLAPVLEKLNIMNSELQALTDAVNGITTDVTALSTNIGTIGTDVTTIIGDLQASGDIAAAVTALGAVKTSLDAQVIASTAVVNSLTSALAPPPAGS